MSLDMAPGEQCNTLEVFEAVRERPGDLLGDSFPRRGVQQI